MPLITYHPSIQMDMILSKLYTDIMFSRDGDKLLMPEAQTLSGFLALCQKPNVCILGFDEGEAGVLDGPWLWACFEPCFGGAFLALWTKPEKRGSKQQARFTFELLEGAFSSCPLVMGVTKQEGLIQEHERMGYRLVGKLPRLWNGQDCWLVTLELADLLAAKERLSALFKTKEAA